MRDVERLQAGIKLLTKQYEEKAAYLRVLQTLNGYRDPNVIAMHTRWCEGQMKGLRLRQRLDALEHELEIINREMMSRMQRKMTSSVVITPIAKSVMDLDRKPPQKNPGRKYVEKGERKPEAGQKSKDRRPKNKKGHRGSRMTAER